MINPLQPGLRQPAGGANSWSFVLRNSPGLNSPNQEEHFSPVPQTFGLKYSTRNNASTSAQFLQTAR